MKKAILLLSMCSLMVLSCGKKEEKETIIENETVVVPQEDGQAPASTAPAATNPDGTTVEVGKNGINVNTKNGDNNTQVRINRDSSNVIIKK